MYPENSRYARLTHTHSTHITASSIEMVHFALMFHTHVLYSTSSEVCSSLMHPRKRQRPVFNYQHCQHHVLTRLPEVYPGDMSAPVVQLPAVTVLETSVHGLSYLAPHTLSESLPICGPSMAVSLVLLTSGPSGSESRSHRPRR